MGMSMDLVEEPQDDVDIHVTDEGVVGSKGKGAVSIKVMEEAPTSSSEEEEEEGSEPHTASNTA